jgi:hypothetical protein
LQIPDDQLRENSPEIVEHLGNFRGDRNANETGSTTGILPIQIFNDFGRDSNQSQTEEQIQALKNSSKKCLVFVAGLEHAPTTGTPHLQGYFECYCRKRLETAKKLLVKEAHIEEARASRDDNIKYCLKEGNVLIEKVPTLSPIQEHYKKLIDAAQIGDRFKVAAEFPKEYVTYNSTIEKMIARGAICKPQLGGNLKHKNFWIGGLPGTGKSRWAAEIMEPMYQYKKNSNKWWCGYAEELHKEVIIEDLDPRTCQCLVNHIKIWADRYTFTGEVKCGSTQIWPGAWYLVVTSNYRIDQCFLNPEDAEAIKRRFTEWWISTPQDIALITRPCVLDESADSSQRESEVETEDTSTEEW